MLHRRSAKHCLSLLTALTFVLGSATSWATQQIPLTEPELVEQSSLIVIGQCTEVKSAWMGRRLMTQATIAVREVLKGEPRSRVTVVIPGGMDAQRAIPVAAVVAGTPQLAPAEEMVLFLSARPDEVGHYAVTGWSQGKLSIREDATGRRLVVPDGGMLPSPDPRKPTTTENSAPAVPLARFRAGILDRVQGHAAEP